MHLWLQLAGKASFSLGDTKRARAEYRKAITQDSFKLLGWEGMAELQLASGELQEAEQTYAQLVSWTPTPVSDRNRALMLQPLYCMERFLAGTRLKTG